MTYESWWFLSLSLSLYLLFFLSLSIAFFFLSLYIAFSLALSLSLYLLFSLSLSFSSYLPFSLSFLLLLSLFLSLSLSLDFALFLLCLLPCSLCPCLKSYLENSFKRKPDFRALPMKIELGFRSTEKRSNLDLLPPEKPDFTRILKSRWMETWLGQQFTWRDDNCSPHHELG